MIEDGVYFDLPHETYHSVDALSASGIKNLLISAPDYWMRSPKNPLRKDEASDAMQIGKAFHKRILEGSAAFYTHYAKEFAAPAGALRTIDEIKNAITELKETPKGKKKFDYIQQLKQLDPGASIADEIEANYFAIHEGKQFIAQDIIASIEVAAAMIEKHPLLQKCVTGGFPEVSVFWTEDGVRFKARFDYLKPRSIVDLKTFDNFMNKPIDTAVYGAIARDKLHIQASFYLRAVEEAKKLLKAGKVDTLFKQKYAIDNFDKDFLASEEHDFFFLFQKKGVAPLARLYKFPKTGIYQSGIAAIEHAIQIYKQCEAKYGADAWLDESDPVELADALFPVWATEI